MLPKATQATGSRQEACPGLGLVLGEEEVRVAQLWGKHRKQPLPEGEESPEWHRQ